jgi:uncharacterized protein with HEPN domain
MIVGEAMYQAVHQDDAIPDQPPEAHRIVSFRHVVVHGYASVVHDTVWAIVLDDVPRLRTEVDRILRNVPPA